MSDQERQSPNENAEIPICPRCMKSMPVDAHICPACHMPVSPLAFAIPTQMNGAGQLDLFVPPHDRSEAEVLSTIRALDAAQKPMRVLQPPAAPRP